MFIVIGIQCIYRNFLLSSKLFFLILSTEIVPSKHLEEWNVLRGGGRSESSCGWKLKGRLTEKLGYCAFLSFFRLVVHFPFKLYGQGPSIHYPSTIFLTLHPNWPTASDFTLPPNGQSHNIRLVSVPNFVWTISAFIKGDK